MKIEGSTKPVGTTLVKDASGTAVRKAPATTSDDVQLSSVATQLQSTDGEYAFDAARVAEIKQAISEGRFSINADAIADRLIASTKELLGSRRQG